MNPTLAQLEAEAIAVPHELGLPPCPRVLLDVGRELRSEAPDVRRVADLIAQDATSAAMVLKTVNSPYYGLRNKARSIQQAIAHLGANRTSLLLAGLLLRNAFPSSSKAAMARFWDTSTELALTAAFVARRVRSVDSGEAHTFGLFREIGTAVLICRFDDFPAMADRDHRGSASALMAWEHERCGVDHATIGARLAADWRLPPEMCDAIRWHHGVFAPAVRHSIADVALRFIALGRLCDRIMDAFHGIPASEQNSPGEAMEVFELSAASFAAIEAAVMAMLEEVCGAPQ